MVGRVGGLGCNWSSVGFVLAYGLKFGFNAVASVRIMKKKEAIIVARRILYE